MKTHEVEEMLGITKQSLIYYEKEGLIHPLRQENNYRDYTQKDIDLLKLILLLRSMEVTIDEIKLILNNQLSIRNVLEQKKDFIHDSQKKLERIDQRINDYIKRRKVKVSFDDRMIDQWKGYDTLYFNNHHIKYNEIMIELSQIKIIQISMYSATGILHAGAGAFGMGSVYFQYYVDIDIITYQDTYSFSILNNDSVCHMFDYFLNHQIIVDDPLKLIKLYHKKRDPVALYNYIHHHFKEWAKIYHLDNPRDSFLNYCHQENNEKNSKKKDFFGWSVIKKALKEPMFEKKKKS